MTQADIEAEQRKFLEGWEEMRALEAAGPPPRKKPVVKKELTPTWTQYINTIWKPEQQAKIVDATKRGTVHKVSDVVKVGINVPTHDFSNSSVAWTRAQDFFKWLQANGPHDEGDGSTGHWPKNWLDVTKLLFEERQDKIIKAKSSSEKVRRKAIDALLEEGLSKADIESMGLKVKWEDHASTSATDSDGSAAAAGSSKATPAANASDSSSSSSNNSKRKRKREGEE